MKILTLAPRKPIVYPPGIISLVLLPVFCLVFLNQHKAFIHQSAMDIAIVDPYFNKRIPEKYQFKFPPERNYLNINLNGVDTDDKIRLDFARLEIKNILKSKDTINGVNFHFGNNARYWTYVKAIEICQTENVQVYGITQDDIVVLYVKPTIYYKSNRICICDGMFYAQPTLYEINQKLWNDRFIRLSKGIKAFWAPALIFLMMLVFAAKKLFLNLNQP